MQLHTEFPMVWGASLPCVPVLQWELKWALLVFESCWAPTVPCRYEPDWSSAWAVWLWWRVTRWQGGSAEAWLWRRRGILGDHAHQLPDLHPNKPLYVKDVIKQEFNMSTMTAWAVRLENGTLSSSMCDGLVHAHEMQNMMLVHPHDLNPSKHWLWRCNKWYSVLYLASLR